MSHWLNAQTLSERLRGLRENPEASSHFNAELARRRLAAWRSGAALANDSIFARMLALQGCTEQEFTQLLGIPTQHLFPADHIPEWLCEILAAEDSAAPIPALPPPFLNGLLNPCLPLLAFYSARLRAAFTERDAGLRAARISPEFLHNTLFSSLCGRAAFLSQRSLALEVNVRSLLCALKGDTAEERFQDFLRTMNDRAERIAFLRKFPLLARNLQRACAFWLEAGIELADRLLGDLNDVRAAFGIAMDDAITEVRGGAGDLHARGRSVMMVTFKSGRRIVYKPHSLAIDTHFQELLGWLNERGLSPPLRQIRVLDRGAYGYVEHVDHVLAANELEVNEFYVRQGSLLALLHGLAATDMHFENIVAAGADPVLVDLETLFHAETSPAKISDAGDACGRRIRQSVMSVGLLPTPVATRKNESYDSSGIGAKVGQSTPYKVISIENVGKDDMRVAHMPATIRSTHNRPRANGPVPVAQLLEGYGRTYRLLLRHRDALLANDGPLFAFRSDPSRIVVRATRVYGQLAQDATHPDLLRDELDRARHWSYLWNSVPERPELEKFLQSELTQAALGDIPFFSLSPGDTNAIGADGTKIPGAVIDSGLTVVQRRLEGFSEEGLLEQSWFIRASFGFLEGFTRGAGTSTTLPGDPLLSSAVDAGREILRGLVRVASSASYLNVACVSGEHEQENLAYAIQPAGTALYEGLAGVSLFLAYLAAESKLPEFDEAANATLNELLHAEEKRKPAYPGAFSGRASTLYLLTHLGVLWDREDLLVRAEDLVPELTRLLEQDKTFDMIAGSAGCLLTLLALARAWPNGGALEAAITCGERLLARYDEGRHSWDLAPFRRGFSHGASGISFALSRLHSATNEPRYLEGALAAAAAERSLIASGYWTDRHFGSDGKHQCSWCHGAAGIAIARTALLDAGPEIEADLRSALDETTAQNAGQSAGQYAGTSQCLCHGVLGNLEPFLLLSQMGRKDECALVLNEATSRLLAAIKSGGWRSAIPSQTLSNGLLTGVAGIGYGLLRLRCPGRVPSVLTLEGPMGSPAAKRKH